MFERCLYFNANTLSRTVNRIWIKSFEPFDLSPAHAYLLRLVLANPGVSQKEAGELLTLEKSTITRFVTALTKKGYIYREKSSLADMRQQTLFPTKKAKKIEERLNDAGNNLYNQMLKNIGKEKLTELVKNMRETTTVLD